ncbi:MAG: hypothetical protein MHMPM18_004677 [Marteilia pararefringens]
MKAEKEKLSTSQNNIENSERDDAKSRALQVLSAYQNWLKEKLIVEAMVDDHSSTHCAHSRPKTTRKTPWIPF